MTANLRIGLNDVQIEEQAVDELIEELQMTDKFLFWIMDYIKENIADDKNWNVISQIKAFGRNIFKDFYKDHADALNNCIEKDGFFEAFSSKLRKMQAEAKSILTRLRLPFLTHWMKTDFRQMTFKIRPEVYGVTFPN